MTRSDASKPGSFVAAAGGCSCPKMAPLVFGVTRLYAVGPSCPLHGVDEPCSGHFAMVESLLRDDCNGSTRWHVVLRPWRDDAKQWGAAVTVPYADVSLIPVEMPGLFGVAGVPEYPEAGHDDA